MKLRRRPESETANRAKRRRLQPARSSSRKNVGLTPGTWLDKLPEDICVRLAAHVCHREQTLDGLTLAKTSPVLRRAVLTVLRRRIVLWDKRSLSHVVDAPKTGDWNTLTNRKWVSVMGTDIREVLQPLLEVLEYRYPPRYTLRVLALPNLRLAEITDHPAHLAAVARACSIRELTLRFRGEASTPECLQCMSKLPLEKLKTYCPPRDQRDPEFRCPYLVPKATDPGQKMISYYLPVLKSIGIFCTCYGENYVENEPFWGVLPSLKTVEEVTFRWLVSWDRIPSEALRFLSTRKSVSVMNSKPAHEFLPLISNSVSGITYFHHVPRGILTREQVRDLGNLPRLRKLCVKVREGDEEELPEMVARLPELIVLDLLWVRNAMNAPRERCPYTGSRFAVATPGAMLRTVEAAPQLSGLCIGKVRIGLVELVTILKLAGKRLRRFETSIGDQEESPFDRLESLLLTVAEHNMGLQAFLVEDIADMSYEEEPLPLEEWRQQAGRVLARLRFFQRRAPLVEIDGLDAYLRNMVAV